MLRTCFVVFTLVLIVAPAAFAEDRDAAQIEAKRIIENLKSKDDDVRAEAATAALGCQHTSLVSPLIKRLRDDSHAVRTGAAAALGARSDKSDKRKAAAALAARMPQLEKDPLDKDELLVVIQALQDLAQTSSIKPLLKGMDKDTDADVRRARLMAVANVPDAEAIERLIGFLDAGRKRARKGEHRAAVDALQWATGAKAGGGADGWRAWWREAKKTFDFEAAAKRRKETGSSNARKKGGDKKNNRKKKS